MYYSCMLFAIPFYPFLLPQLFVSKVLDINHIKYWPITTATTTTTINGIPTKTKTTSTTTTSITSTTTTTKGRKDPSKGGRRDDISPKRQNFFNKIDSS